MRGLRRAVAVGLLITAATVHAAGPALAEVTVSAAGTTPGAESVVTLRVVNVRTSADLVAVRVELPAGAGSVSVADRPGWTVAPVSVVDGAPTVVQWTADTAPLAPGRFGDFAVALGSLPAASSVSLPVVESYSDGDEARYGVPAPGPAAPLPAPSFVLAPVPAGAAEAATGTDGTARLLGMAALLIGLVGCGIAASAGRSRPTDPAGSVLGLPARLFPAELSRPSGPVGGRPVPPDRPAPQSRDKPSW